MMVNEGIRIPMMAFSKIACEITVLAQKYRGPDTYIAR